MIFRITDYVHYGTLDNRKRGTVHLTLQLMGMPHPVNITLHGDCLQDLAGCVVDFRNPSPQMLPAELTWNGSPAITTWCCWKVRSSPSKFPFPNG